MAQLRVSAAARAVGKDRGTLNRYIKSGKLSTSKDASGCIVIETAELLRVFGELRGDGRDAPGNAAACAGANSGVQHVLEATLELLKQQLHASQDRESKLLAMLEQEQQARRDLEQRLLPPSQEQPPVWEAAAESAAGSAPDRAEDKRGFFGRLFGG